MDLSDLRAFLLVVEYGSFQGASVALRGSRGGLRRQVERLEKELGVSLLRRGAHGIEATAAGAEVVAGAAQLLREAETLAERVRTSSAGARGLLRFIVPTGFSVQERVPAVMALRAAHPELNLQVVEAEDPLTRIGEPFDLMIHFGDPPEREGWFSRVLGRMPIGLRAAPRYLEAHGHPGSLADLTAHSLIVWREGGKERGLPLRAGGSAPVSPWLRLANLSLVLALGAAGAGIVYAPVLPRFLTGTTAELTPVLADEVGGTLTIRMLSPRPSAMDPKVRALLENLKRMLAAFRDRDISSAGPR